MAYCSAEDQSKQLREFLRSLGAQVGEEAKVDIKEDMNDLVSHIIFLAKLTSDPEIEMVLNSLISLIVTVPRDDSDGIVKKMCELLQSDEFKGREATLLHVLSNLFYGFSGAGKQQYQIYCTMLSIAAKSSLVKSMITDLNRIKEWFAVWKLSVEEQRICLRQLHAALSQGQQADELSKVMFELLSTYTTDADALKAKDDASECVRSSLADPGTYVFDHLLSLKPVQSLAGAGSSSHELVYQLLQIFVSGSLRDYEKFYSSNKTYVDSTLKLSHENLSKKIRVLTLITLCENKTEVPLQEVAEALNLTVGDQLDDFIITAVQSKAIRAKIDQVHGRLIIGGVKNRRFSTQHWEQLRNKLEGWSTSLKQVKKYMDSVVAVEN